MRYRATVEYDGTDFEGFQRQAAGHRTVQGELEGALGRIGWRGTSLMAAGRTDSGVHGRGQVIAFDHDWRHTPDALVRALNAQLPADVSVRGVVEAEADFHPRYWARARTYVYTVYQGPQRAALRDRYAWHVVEPLDAAALAVACLGLIGRHDFATFGTDPDEGTNTVRTVQRAEWVAAGETWRFWIQADAFLFRMVRSVVGALVRVGTGVLTTERFLALIEARDRSQCPPLAPARGLCLDEVLY
ncbi:MAG: tRNA pseudouridine(38-40) synthase TruA [Anaerolineales bacterium]|nr:tRNA pseudouridine(38-40) synthase TruA [Anaerolineales bacterium]